VDIIVVFLAVVFLFFILRNSLNILDIIVMTDILLRVLNWLFMQVRRDSIINDLDHFLPDSLLELINNYTIGTVNDVLTIVYYLAFVAAIFFIIKRLVLGKKK